MNLQPRPYPKSTSYYTSDILWKAEKLGVLSETLHGKDLEDFKIIIRKAWRTIAKRQHPDAGKRKGAGGSFGYKGFNEKNKIYKELMALKEEDIIRERKRTETIPDIPNPWDIWRMGRSMPVGAQESFDHLMY